jgi:cysteine-rich repeat protein
MTLAVSDVHIDKESPMSRLLVCAFALAAACTTSPTEKEQVLTSPAQTTQLDPEAPDAGTIVVDAGEPADAGSASLCGNGVIDPGEQCDDGSANGTPGDDCSATCQCLPS